MGEASDHNGGGIKRKVSGGRTMQVDAEELRSYLANAEEAAAAGAEAVVVDPNSPSSSAGQSAAPRPTSPPPLPKANNRPAIVLGIGVVVLCVLAAVGTGIWMGDGFGATAATDAPTQNEPPAAASEAEVTDEVNEDEIVPIALEEVVVEADENAGAVREGE